MNAFASRIACGAVSSWRMELVVLARRNASLFVFSVGRVVAAALVAATPPSPLVPAFFAAAEPLPEALAELLFKVASGASRLPCCQNNHTPAAASRHKIKTT